MKHIVVTSIYSPTEALKLYSCQLDSKLVVVGDIKTPPDWRLAGAKYISIDEQKKSQYRISKLLPYNHYSRKMIGYLYSIQHCADAIVDTDDDNIPNNNWGFPDFTGSYNVIAGHQGFINVYRHFTDKHVWPRGLPLNLITKCLNLPELSSSQQKVNVGVWQGLADQDPDVDALYRLTDDTPIIFNTKEPLVLCKGVISPFNSQNTIFRSECFPLLYLPAYVTFRFTDILRGLVAQPIMWAHGYTLGFIGSTVTQKRNSHDYMADFESELPMYAHSGRIIDLISDHVSSHHTIAENMINAYRILQVKGIVQSKELELLDAWLWDLENSGQHIKIS